MDIILVLYRGSDYISQLVITTYFLFLTGSDPVKAWYSNGVKSFHQNNVEHINIFQLKSHTREKCLFNVRQIHTPLLKKNSIKSCLVRNFTAGDCKWLALRDDDAEDVDGPEDEGGSDEVDGVEEGGSGWKVDGAVEVDGVEEADGVEEVEATSDEEADVAGRLEGLSEAAPVSARPLALDSPVVWFSLLSTMGSGRREWRLLRPRSVRRKLWYLKRKTRERYQQNKTESFSSGMVALINFSRIAANVIKQRF